MRWFDSSTVLHVVTYNYKKRIVYEFLGHTKHATRKDRRHVLLGHSCNPGKKNKVQYHRYMRNSRKVPFDLKNSEWKKLPGCNLWNWC